MLERILELKEANIALIGERESGRSSFALYLANKIKKDKLFYLFSNINDTIKNFSKINLNKKIIKLYFFLNINDIIKIYKENILKIKDSIIIFDDIYFLNLSLEEKIKYYNILNMLLLFISSEKKFKNNINLFISLSDEKQINNLLKYWCDYIIKIENKIEKLKIFIEDLKNNFSGELELNKSEINYFRNA